MADVGFLKGLAIPEANLVEDLGRKLVKKVGWLVSSTSIDSFG